MRIFICWDKWNDRQVHVRIDKTGIIVMPLDGSEEYGIDPDTMENDYTIMIELKEKTLQIE